MAMDKKQRWTRTAPDRAAELIGPVRWRHLAAKVETNHFSSIEVIIDIISNLLKSIHYNGFQLTRMGNII